MVPLWVCIIVRLSLVLLQVTLPVFAWAVCHYNTSEVYLLDFFCSGIQFYLLLSPNPCFISLLYLDLYVQGDDALMS